MVIPGTPAVLQSLERYTRKSDHNNASLGRLKSHAKSNGAGGSAANHLGQDNVDENGDVEWDNMSSYVLPGASDGDEAVTKAEKTSAAVVAAYTRYKKEWDNCADNAEGAKKELADVGRHRKSGEEIRLRQKLISSAMRTHNRVDPHLPLKDDPRFSAYFQMMRSSAPRSWIERAMDVDDRDVTILDLDQPTRDR